MNVGYVGLGNMGAPLARRLIGKYPLVVHDLNPAVVRGFVERGATAARNGKDLAAQCEIVLTCLPTSEHVHAAIFGEDGLLVGLAAGSLIVDMTTGDPLATRRMAAELAERGMALIDAPVSGGPKGAEAGTIAIIVGASQELFARAKPVLDAISCNVLHAGEVGAGHTVKVANNLLNLACRLATFEAVSLCVKNGVAPENAVDIIQKSSGRNYATEITLPDNILSGRMVQGFTLGLMEKDCRLATGLARESGVPMPLGALARETIQGLINELGADADMSTVALLYERLTGARIRPPD